MDSMRGIFVSLVLVLLLLTGGSTSASAQGSPYNLFSFGTPVRSASPVLEAMGGVGAALQGTRTISDINPADWTWLGRARFDIAMRFEYMSATLGSAQDQQHSVHFDGITFGAPFWDDYKATVALGYLPMTSASSEIDNTDSIGTRNNVSTGGANLLFIGMGLRPTAGLALGLRLDMITGDIRHQDHIAFSNAESDSAEFERDYLFSGFRPTFGIELIGDSLGGVFDGLAIGGSYSLATSLSTTRETIITPISSSLDTTIDVGGVGRYPASFVLGLSYRFSPRYRAELDYASQDFSTAFVYAPTSITGDTTLRKSTRISFGLERLANIAGEFGTSFGLDKWALRLGFSYSQLPFSPGLSGGVSEFALSGGVGIPISFESLMNLTAVFGQRRPTNANAAPNETFFRLGASVSLSEKWFSPTRRE